MENGTVEYTPMFIKKVDSYNNTYYETNYGPDNKSFITAGKIEGIKNPVKLYSVDAYVPNGGGYVTTIATNKDGSFYDLNNIIQK